MTVSWIGSEAGEETVGGVSRPPLPIVNVAGTRTFVAAAPVEGAYPDVAGPPLPVPVAVAGPGAGALAVAVECVEPPHPTSAASAPVTHTQRTERLKLLTGNADK